MTTEITMMKTTQHATALFLDIGGVLLTNGWDHGARDRAAKTFGLDREELEFRHNLTFSTYEEGKLTLRDYLDRVVFHAKRPFTALQFEQFMFDQSRPYQDMIELVRALKERFHLKIVVVSNEGRELTVHRIQTYKLHEFVDFFISSCFVHFRKPDRDIFQIALDISQVPASQVIYVEDRPMFVQEAERLGIAGIVHENFETTRRRLAEQGLELDEAAWSAPLATSSPQKEPTHER